MITSEFVTRAQEQRRAQRVDSLEQTIDRIARDLGEIREQLGQLGDGDVRPPPA